MSTSRTHPEYSIVVYDRQERPIETIGAGSLREAHDIAFSLHLTNASVSIYNRRDMWLAEYCIHGIPDGASEPTASQRSA